MNRNDTRTKVTIETQKVEEDLILNNGDLLIVNSSVVYIITSFRHNDGRTYRKDCKEYCSLVNLTNGYLAFEEPCSRQTNSERIRHHLSLTRDNKIELLKSNFEIKILRGV